MAGQCSLAYEALSPGRALLARMLVASAAWRERLRTATYARHSKSLAGEQWALHDAFLEACDAADVGSADFSLRAFFYRVRDAYWVAQVCAAAPAPCQECPGPSAMRQDNSSGPGLLSQQYFRRAHAQNTLAGVIPGLPHHTCSPPCLMCARPGPARPFMLCRDATSPATGCARRRRATRSCGG